MWTGLLILAAIIGIALILGATLAPLEALGWWAGWSGPYRDRSKPLITQHDLEKGALAHRDDECYVVYFTGVGRWTGTERADKEENFLDLLEQRCPRLAIVRDLFPYSVANQPLTRRRVLAPLWRRLSRIKRTSPAAVLRYVYMLRNVLQVAVSADPRYGAIYGYGVALECIRKLVREGYVIGSNCPVTLLCVSGGGQIAVGAAPYLRKLLNAPVYVLSVGGVLTSDPGILAVQHLYHLSGTKDQVQSVGRVLYAGRWPIMRWSAWNRALRQGKFTWLNVGPMTHMGAGDYFSRSSQLPNGESHVEKVVDVCAGVFAELACAGPQVEPETVQHV
jgi:hypothetical protein